MFSCTWSIFPGFPYGFWKHVTVKFHFCSNERKIVFFIIITFTWWRRATFSIWRRIVNQERHFFFKKWYIPIKHQFIKLLSLLSKFLWTESFLYNLSHNNIKILLLNILWYYIFSQNDTNVLREESNLLWISTPAFCNVIRWFLCSSILNSVYHRHLNIQCHLLLLPHKTSNELNVKMTKIDVRKFEMFSKLKEQKGLNCIKNATIKSKNLR